MSRGIVCDNCGECLVVNKNGEDEDGESSGWLKLITGVGDYDLCTRACLAALLDDEHFVEAMTVHAEGIAEVIRTIRGDDVA